MKGTVEGLSKRMIGSGFLLESSEHEGPVKEPVVITQK